jgi:hypothetical protein
MTRLIITETQYQKILMYEEAKTPEFSHSKEVLLAFATIIGCKLKGQNKFSASRALKRKKVLSDILNILKDPNKESELLADLESKGMYQPSDKLIVKSEDIVNKFNQYANEVGLTEKMTLSDLLNSVLGNQ